MAIRYPGRGIVLGKTPDGQRPRLAYFIMGRSANSRNRVFDADGTASCAPGPMTPSKVEDPSPHHLRARCGMLADHADRHQRRPDRHHVRDVPASRERPSPRPCDTRCFEPDGPNFTPRISGLLHLQDGRFYLSMHILKSRRPARAAPASAIPFAYPAPPGLGHFLHTYVCDGNPIPILPGRAGAGVRSGGSWTRLTRIAVENSRCAITRFPCTSAIPDTGQPANSDRTSRSIANGVRSEAEYERI